MNKDQKLDEILAIVRKIGSLDAEVIATRNALDEAQKSETDGNRAWQELHEKAVEATLKAYNLFESIAKGLADAEADRVMDSSELKRRLSAWREAKKVS